MSRPLHFVWGPGGVGKTHFSIREAYRQKETSRLLTLDPSPRLLHLLHLENSSRPQEKVLGEKKISVRQTDADKLFERLNKIKPANPGVRIYYQELVKGLHRFRDYLCLIDLADEIQKPESFKLIVDTSPLSEAHGLTRSIEDLHKFFRSPLFQLGSRSRLFQASFRKALDFAKSFLGKAGVEQALEFVDWLNQHLEIFEKSTEVLEGILHREETIHTLILTPESSPHQISIAREFLKDFQNLKIILNRSVQHLPEVPGSFVSLHQELESRRSLEEKTEALLKQSFPGSTLMHFPLQLMGEDTEEELLRFVSSEKGTG